MALGLVQNGGTGKEKIVARYAVERLQMGGKGSISEANKAKELHLGKRGKVRFDR